MNEPLRVLFLVPTDLESLECKGVSHLLSEREEDGALERCITIHPFSNLCREVQISPRHTVYEYSLREYNKIPRFFRWFIFASYLFLSAYRVALVIHRERINVVRAQDPYYMGFIGWLAVMFFSRTAFCISIHADYDKRYELDGARGGTIIFGSRSLAKRLERFLLRRADLVMPIRKTLARKVAVDGVSPEAVFVIPHGIDLRPFLSATNCLTLRAKFDLPDDYKIVSFVGRLSRENYVYDIVEVAYRLRNRDDTIIVMAGDGPEGDSLNQKCAGDPVLRKMIRLVGFLDRQMVAALRKCSNVSLVPMGGFSLIEACAASTPVVTYDIEWHSELVQNNKTGFLVSEHDLEALEASICYLLDKKEEAVQMGLHARELVKERHSLKESSLRKVMGYRAALLRRNKKSRNVEAD